MRKLGTRCTSRSTIVVLPVPDGAETMNSSPSPPRTRPGDGLFDILDLLAHPLELRLGVDDEFRHAQAVGLGADGVDLPVHLLEQKIELAAARLVAVHERGPMRQVRPEPCLLYTSDAADERSS